MTKPKTKSIKVVKQTPAERIGDIFNKNLKKYYTGMSSTYTLEQVLFSKTNAIIEYLNEITPAKKQRERK